MNRRRRRLGARPRARWSRSVRAARRRCAAYGVERIPRERRRRARDQPHRTGSTCRSSAPPRRARSTSWRRPRRTACPGSASSIRCAGTIAGAPRRVRPRRRAADARGRSRDGPRARPLRRGHAAAKRRARRRRSPGAAMVAIQEDVPVVPAAIYGTQFWKAGNWRRSRSRSASRCASRGCPKGGEGLPGGDRRDRAEYPRALRLARRHPRAGTAASATPPV